MSNTKSIEFAFVNFWKSAQPLKLSNGRKAIPSSGNNFVNVSLMTNIPHNSVVRGVVYIMECQCKLNHTQTSTEMTTFNRNNINQIFSQFNS